MNAISQSELEVPKVQGRYQGKVRDVYYLTQDRVLMVTTDRISAFDVVLPRPIPNKGAILTGIAAFFLEMSKDLVPNWFESCPDPQVMVGKACDPYKVEMVIRGYLTGHAWREYRDGKRQLCGVPLPEGLKEHDRLPEPIITPATKAEEGHDEDISREEIIRQGIVPEAEYLKLEEYTRALFRLGSEYAATRGLILVDTKYEFGRSGNDILLIDEIHTPDSSRYFYAEGYEDRQMKGQGQRQLSKEFVREWLISEGFQGKEGQVMPAMPDDRVEMISGRYAELYERLIGRPFEALDADIPVSERMQQNIDRHFGLA